MQLASPHADERLKCVLNAFVDKSDAQALVRADPVELVHKYTDPHDQEVAGLIVSTIAYGRVASIKSRARSLLTLLGPSPAAAVDSGAIEATTNFVYRFQRGRDFPEFLLAIGRVRARHGSLAQAFCAGLDDGQDYGESIDRFVMMLRDAIDGPITSGIAFLLPRCGESGGAAKRICLYLRWMVRPPGGEDLGTWHRFAPSQLDPAKLIIPLDTHIERICRYIGLTERKSKDLATARDITRSLVRLRPHNPVAYDSVLCHLGISGRCPGHRDVEKCSDCPIRSVCRLGRQPKGWEG